MSLLKRLNQEPDPEVLQTLTETLRERFGGDPAVVHALKDLDPP